MIDYTQHPLNKKYDLDTALSTIWEFYKKWFGSFVLIAFVFSLVTTYLTGRIDISELYSVTDPEEMMEIVKAMIGPYSLILLFTFVFSLVLQYYIIRKPVDPDSNIFTIGTQGLVKFFLPLLALLILLSLFAVFALMVGVLLLFVGALFAIVYVVMLYAFVVPVLMIEDKGISHTITESIKLAHKRFWPNIGWVTIFIILLMVISFILSAIIMIPFGGSFVKSILNPENASSEMLNFASKPSFIVLNAIINALTMPLFPIFSLVLYFNARSYYSGEAVNNASSGDNEGRVKIEDLYSGMADKKKGTKRKDESAPPSIEDLMP
ncbi:MAG: hypothetical protein ACQETA_09435 [Bacteroidota bacterium]